jgi:hypothetical protein
MWIENTYRIPQEYHIPVYIYNITHVNPYNDTIQIF